MSAIIKNSLISILLGALILGATIFIIAFYKDYTVAKKNKNIEKEGSVIGFSIIGLFIGFIDTLGIGGFAPMTVFFREFKVVKDKNIPGTLNTAMCLPIIAEALIFTREVPVDPLTLISMLISATLGAIMGAKIVVKLDEKKMKLGMAIALTAILLLMLAGKVGIFPAAGTEVGLTGIKLIIAIVGNFILGALMTLGIGLYAPCMALVYALGLSPRAAFPIMMCSCAFLMPIVSLKFIKENSYNRRATLIISITGVIGVVIAAYLIKELSLDILTWVVIVAIFYTASKLFLESKKEEKKKTILNEGSD